MKQRFHPILAIALPVMLAGLMVANAFGQNNQAPATNAQVAALINQIEDKLPPYWQWDASGNLISLDLYAQFANDANLALLSTVGSIQRLYIQGKPHGSAFTQTGIRSLSRLTNLTELNVYCTFEMPAATFEEICRFRGLRNLSLWGAFPPSDGYKNLAGLTNLEELNITACSNFGPRELRLLTNLMNLKSLRLDLHDGSKSDTNILGCMKNLTNLEVSFHSIKSP